MAVELLQPKFPVKLEVIKESLQKVKLPGRIQVIQGDVTKIFDVSHNPAAAEFLAVWLTENPCDGKTRAVFSMLADKDIVQTIWVMKNLIDEWFVAPLSGPRAASQGVLEYCFRKASVSKVNFYPQITDAYPAAMKKSKSADCVVVFGSFHTVAEVQNT